VYTTIDQFRRDFRETTEGTLKVLRALTDESLSQAVVPGGRTLGRIAWHLVGTLTEMPAHAGLPVDPSVAEAPVPTRADEVVSTYQRAVVACEQAVVHAWSDADLLGEIGMYGETWSRARVLAVLMAHEVHHRGQMTVLMRQAGLRVPGVMGPAEEEWAAMGMPVQP